MAAGELRLLESHILNDLLNDIHILAILLSRIGMSVIDAGPFSLFTLPGQNRSGFLVLFIYRDNRIVAGGCRKEGCLWDTKVTAISILLICSGIRCL